jgi:hypothetical protein
MLGSGKGDREGAKGRGDVIGQYGEKAEYGISEPLMRDTPNT